MIGEIDAGLVHEPLFRDWSQKLATRGFLLRYVAQTDKITNPEGVTVAITLLYEVEKEGVAYRGKTVIAVGGVGVFAMLENTETGRRSGLFVRQTRVATATDSSVEIVGGWINPGETDVQAAVREFLEETGIELGANMLRPLGTWDLERGLSSATIALFGCTLKATTNEIHILSHRISGNVNEGEVTALEVVDWKEAWAILWGDMKSILALQLFTDLLNQ